VLPAQTLSIRQHLSGSTGAQRTRWTRNERRGKSCILDDIFGSLSALEAVLLKTPSAPQRSVIAGRARPGWNRDACGKARMRYVDIGSAFNYYHLYNFGLWSYRRPILVGLVAWWISFLWRFAVTSKAVFVYVVGDIKGYWDRCIVFKSIYTKASEYNNGDCSVPGYLWKDLDV
jgi:hypothetical protein